MQLNEKGQDSHHGN